jgi:hypothetical protein
MSRQLTATWTAKQEWLALLLAAGWGIKAAAKELKVGERTAHTWLEDPGYRAFVDDLRRRMLEEAVGKLTDAAGSAVDVLRDLLAHPNGGVRLRAAMGVLDCLLKYRQHAELDRRVAGLEERLSDAEYKRSIEQH